MPLSGVRPRACSGPPAAHRNGRRLSTTLAGFAPANIILPLERSLQQRGLLPRWLRSFNSGKRLISFPSCCHAFYLVLTDRHRLALSSCNIGIWVNFPVAFSQR